MKNENVAQATKEDIERHRQYLRNQEIKLFIHGIFWKTLWFLHLARIYSRFACRLNIYAKFGMSGRCQYCGELHGIHWKIKTNNHRGLTLTPQKKRGITKHLGGKL